MKIKPGVLLEGISWRMFWAALVVEKVFQEYGFLECTITSAVEGKHRTLKHPNGEALDFRIWHLKMESLRSMEATIRSRLSDDYDVELESDHFHIEWDPK